MATHTITHEALRGVKPGNRFMFATGIENSYPVVTGSNGASVRVDELAKCGFYERWQTDFELVKELGLGFLRYGPQYYHVNPGPGKYDWQFTAETFAQLKRLQITAIADLCHFGVPDWIGDFQNTDWPELFAEYAGAFARRFPWVRFFTPVNEIFVCADFSARQGIWNERQKSDGAFVTAIRNMCRAAILAEQAILEVQPNALFIQSEGATYYHGTEPAAEQQADFYNELRFVSFDLCYGHPVHARIYEYLMDNHLSRDEYHWFLEQGQRVRPHCIMGNDYYFPNERSVGKEGEMSSSGEVFGYYVITKEYYDRYRMPVMHTETNLAEPDKAPGWLWKQWCCMKKLKFDGVPILGFTWYSLTDQVDWDTQLTQQNGRVNELGLYDLDRKIRPVGETYKQLVALWGEILPMESLALYSARS
jgi:beta-glucosidase/6-phospho-beta-glucosidase/beta-galactosidase